MLDIPLPIYFFTKEYPLKSSNKGTHIPSLIELKMKRLINCWTDMFKFKIEKINYSKSYSRTMYEVSTNKPLLYP